MEHNDIIKKGLEHYSFSENRDNIIEKFEKYTNFLIKYNENVNLTAITEPGEVALLHHVDSFSALAKVDFPINSRVIDIGSGAGFPLVPMKIVRPDLECTLADSLNKRIVFLKKLVQLLELDGIEPIHSRAEELGQNTNYRGTYDFVCVRGVGKMSLIAEYSIPLLKTGGKLIALKGPKAEEELKEAKNALKMLKSEVEGIYDSNLPFPDIDHKIVVIGKNGQTPKNYPRNPGVIKKKPL